MGWYLMSFTARNTINSAYIYISNDIGFYLYNMTPPSPMIQIFSGLKGLIDFCYFPVEVIFSTVRRNMGFKIVDFCARCVFLLPCPPHPFLKN